MQVCPSIGEVCVRRCVCVWVCVRVWVGSCVCVEEEGVCVCGCYPFHVVCVECV